MYRGEKRNTRTVVPGLTSDEKKEEAVLKQKREALRKMDFSFFFVMVDVSEVSDFG